MQRDIGIILIMLTCTAFALKIWNFFFLFSLFFFFFFLVIDVVLVEHDLKLKIIQKIGKSTYMYHPCLRFGLALYFVAHCRVFSFLWNRMLKY